MEVYLKMKIMLYEVGLHQRRLNTVSFTKIPVRERWFDMILKTKISNMVKLKSFELLLVTNNGAFLIKPKISKFIRYGIANEKSSIDYLHSLKKEYIKSI